MKKVRTHLLTTAAVVALSGSAFAADMGLPMKAAPAPAPIPYAQWQGFYIGGNIGAARLNASASQTVNTGFPGIGCGGAYWASLDSCTTSATGLTAGVQAGYDWQSRYFVYGVVADWSWTGLKHKVSQTNTHTIVPHFEAKVNWLASFRGRMGLAVDDTLVYVTGGLALGQVKSNTGICQTTSCSNDGDWTNGLSKVATGWVAGAGVEHKISQNWSVMGEFLYYDLGRQSASATTDSGTYTTEFTHEVIQARVGLNYRF